jgi:hypothetical protein
MTTALVKPQQLQQPQQARQAPQPRPGLAQPKPVGLGQQAWEGWALAGGLGLAGGLLGYWIGGKKHGALGAGVGAVAGVVVTPVIIGALMGNIK